MSIRTPLTGSNATAAAGSVPANVDPMGRFSIRAELYKLHRPTYPGEDIMSLLLAETALGDALRSSNARTISVADIGSGTGISTRLFLVSPYLQSELKAAGKGMIIYGVEPNEPMRKAAEVDLADYELPGDEAPEPGHVRFVSIDGSAEVTKLADHSVDLIVAFQAGHWFKTSPTRVEFQRILRASPAGKPNLMLVWNTRRPPPPESEAEQRILAIHEKHRAHDSSGAEASSGERHTKIAEALLGAPDADGVPKYKEKILQHALPFSLAGYQGFAHSISFMPPAGTPAGDELDRELESVFDMAVAEQRKAENVGKPREEQTVDIVFDAYVFYGTV